MGPGFVDGIEREALERDFGVDLTPKIRPENIGDVEGIGGGQNIAQLGTDGRPVIEPGTGETKPAAAPVSDPRDAQYQAWENRLSAQQQQLQQQMQTMLERMQPGQQTAPAEKAADSELPYVSVKDQLGEEHWKALPDATRAALSGLDGANRRNIEALYESMKTGMGPQTETLKALADEVSGIKNQLTRAQEQALENTWAQQATAARKEYGDQALAPHVANMTRAMNQYKCSVEDAIRLVAPEVWTAKQTEKITNQVRQQLRGEFNMESLFGGAGVAPPKNLGYEAGESFAQSAGKVMHRANGPGL